MLDYGARLYDPLTVRWNGVDGFAEVYHKNASYSYVLGNPVSNIDVKGLYVRGDKTVSLNSFINEFKICEIEAAKYRIMDPLEPTYAMLENLNHAKIRIFDTDFRATKQIVSKVGSKDFSYNQSFGKYLDVGLPLDVAHFFKLANLAQDYPDFAVRWAYVREEFKQAEDTRPAGRTSAFAPEDLFSNELGVIFGSVIGACVGSNSPFGKNGGAIPVEHKT